MQGAMGLGILGRRQVTPRWENNPVWEHDGGNRIVVRGGCGYPPPGRKTGRGQRRVEQVKKSILRNNKQHIIGTEGSLSKAGTSPPHDADTSRGFVAR